MNLVHCEGYSVRKEPFIVPPTWNKTQYHEQIETVWRRAATELSEARNIFIIGYSFSETDEFFKHLFALSLVGGPALSLLAIVNPNGEVADRFLSIAGSQIKSKIKPIGAKFAKSVSQMTHELVEQGLY